MDSDMVVLSLKVKELEKKNKEIIWVLERNQVVIEALFDDFRKRNFRKRNDSNVVGGGMYS